MAFLLKRCGWMAAAALAAAPCVEAGPMKWQITGMDGFALRYRLAQQVEAVKAASGVAQHAESIWSMTGLPDTADSVMKWEIWSYLQFWLVRNGKAEEEGKITPSYRDLIMCGYISVNQIEMPELVVNAEF